MISPLYTNYIIKRASLGTSNQGSALTKYVATKNNMGSNPNFGQNQQPGSTYRPKRMSNAEKYRVATDANVVRENNYNKRKFITNNNNNNKEGFGTSVANLAGAMIGSAMLDPLRDRISGGYV